jgi:YggT family protein
MALVSLALTLFTFVLLARAILSWFPRPTGALASIDHAATVITEPVVAPVRRFVPAVGGFDLSILLVFLGIYVIRMVLRI